VKLQTQLFLDEETLSVLRVTPFSGCNPPQRHGVSARPRAHAPQKAVGAQQRAYEDSMLSPDPRKDASFPVAPT